MGVRRHFASQYLLISALLSTGEAQVVDSLKTGSKTLLLVSALFIMKDIEPDINSRIWQVITLIPPGKVATYGDVAKHAGLPGAARRVGNALRGLPADTKIPWHRVINARGQLSLPQNSTSGRTQRARLETEDVYFRDSKSVDLRRFRWKPENPACPQKAK